MMSGMIYMRGGFSWNKNKEKGERRLILRIEERGVRREEFNPADLGVGGGMGENSWWVYFVQLVSIPAISGGEIYWVRKYSQFANCELDL